jgi:hypothetical protein
MSKEFLPAAAATAAAALDCPGGGGQTLWVAFGPCDESHHTPRHLLGSMWNPEFLLQCTPDLGEKGRQHSHFGQQQRQQQKPLPHVIGCTAATSLNIKRHSSRL